jgi:hypothetical protein
MPCYERRITTVVLETAHLDLLEKALQTLGAVTRHGASMTLRHSATYGTKVEIKDGKVSLDENYKYIVDEIKQAYAKQVVRAAAKKFGWHVKEDNHNKNKMTVGRRF